MAKAKKKGNYIILAERTQTREYYFLESVSYSKRNFKLLPLKDIDKAKTYASADTVQQEIDFLSRCDMGLICAYDTPENWKFYFKQHYDMDL